MISDWVHSPDDIIQAVRDVVQGHARTEIAGGKHPSKLLPPETSVVSIFEEKFPIIPIDKPILERREKNDKGHKPDESWDEERGKPKVDPTGLGKARRTCCFSAWF